MIYPPYIENCDWQNRRYGPLWMRGDQITWSADVCLLPIPWQVNNVLNNFYVTRYAATTISTVAEGRQKYDVWNSR